MERIASGYALAEAPVAAPDGSLYFSDVLGGGVYRFVPGTDVVETVVAKRRGVGGMALHAEGGLVMTGREVIHVHDGQTRTLYGDPEVPGFNDLTVAPDGRVIFGCVRFRPFQGESPIPGEFIHLDGTVVVSDVMWVNGCAFSPDGSTFYGCDYQRGVVFAADAGEDGTYGPSRQAVVSPTGAVDGLAVDESGCLWVALGPSASVGRFTPAGDLDMEITVDADFVASLCFAGSDGRDLYITTSGQPDDPGARGGVFVTRAPVAGLPVPAATE
jgi:gluconolactonase